MKLGRRDKRRVFKTSIMGRMLGDLLHRGRREQARQGAVAKAAVAQAAKPRGQVFSLDPLEPRLLMSADIGYVASGITNTLNVAAHASGSQYFIDITGGLVTPIHQRLSAAGDVNVNLTSAGGATAGALTADTLHFNLDTFSVLGAFVNAHGGLLTLDFAGGSEALRNDHVLVDGASASVGYGLKLHSSADISTGAHAAFTGDLTLASDDSITATASTQLSARNLTLRSAPVSTGGAVPGTGILANANGAITITGAHLTASQTLTLDSHAKVTVSSDGTAVSGVTGAVITSFSAAKVDIGGASVLQGKLVAITATVDANLNATATNNTVKLVSVIGGAAPEITVNGTARIAATSSLTAQAASNVTITASASPAATATDAKFDAAVVNTTFSSGASLTIAGAAGLTATGSVALGASSTLVSSTVADANVANTAGAAVAVSTITGDTDASVTGATVTGSAITLGAQSDRTITTTARSSPGGAKSNGGADQSEKTLASSNAATSQGSITVGGAIAVSSDIGDTEAHLSGATLIAGAGAATVSASSADVVKVAADGEFTQKGTNGVGVGVAIGVADRGTFAYITGTTHVTAGSLSVQVLAPKPSSFSAQAIAGVGNSSTVGFAGALAFNITVLDHEAYLDQGASLILTGSPNVTFSVAADISNAASATPANGGTADSVGIGASVALSYSEDQIAATIENNASLTGAKNLTLSATSDHDVATTATGGGKGATAITPVVALAISDDDSQASLGTGTALTIAGNFSATSTLANRVATTAIGDTKSSKTGVGVSLALNVVNDHSTATTGRNLIAATGAVAFLSNTLSGSRASARASVAGGEADDGSGQHSGGSSQSVDNKAKREQSFGGSTATGQVRRATKNNSATTKGDEGKSGPSASTSSGSVSVAGAIAINLESASSIATIGNGRAITASGVLTVKSTTNVDGAASADGSAGTGSGGTSVAAAVAINYATDDNLATIGSATISPGGLDVEARQAVNTMAFKPSAKVDLAADTVDIGTNELHDGDAVVYHKSGAAAIGGLSDGKIYYVDVQDSGKLKLYDTFDHALAAGTVGLVNLTSVAGTGATDNFTDSTSSFAADAQSGAGGGNYGVAGALAFNLAFTNAKALVGTTGAAPTIAITGGGSVTLTTIAALANRVRARPSDGGGVGSKVGVGISIGLNDAENTSLAQVADGTTLAGAKNITLTANSTQRLANSVTGGGKSQGTAVTPVIAITITDNDTDATIGSGGLLSFTGALSAQAVLTDSVVAAAIGDTQSNSTGVGISVAVTVVNDNALATTARDLTGGGAITFSASAQSLSDSTAKASVAGGQQDDGSGKHNDSNASDQTVDHTTQQQTAFGDQKAKEKNSSARGTEGQASNNQGKTSDGGVSVAGAVAVDVENASAKAFIPDLRHVTAGGLLTVKSATNVDGHAIASGSASTSSGGTGVGAAVAVDIANNTNLAYIGNNTVISAGGVVVQAGMATRSVPIASSTVQVVDTTQNSIFVGLDAGLNTGDKLTYNRNGSTAIGGLTDGSDYYAHVLEGGRIQLYDTAAHAAAGGATGLVDLTTAGTSGQQHKFNHGLLAFAGIGALTFTTGPLRLLDLGSLAGLHTGDAVTYSVTGGTAMGGLVNGQVYYAIEVSPGEYLLADTLADARAGKAIVLTSAGTGTQSFADVTSTSRADATSGGGGGKIGIAGSVAVNIANNDVEAVIGRVDPSLAVKPPTSVALTITGGGSVSVSATNAADSASRALPSNGGGKGSSVGVGASVAVNVVNNSTLARIADGTAWTGTAGGITVAASSSTAALTHGENGASSGSVAVGVGAAVAVLHDTTSAYVGTGANIAATGTIAITAAHTADIETSTSAQAASSSVGVGASVSVAVVVENTSAELARGILTSGGAFTLTSASTVSSRAIAIATAKGEDKSDSQQNSSNDSSKTGADGQADHEINDNSATKGSDTQLASASDQKDSANSSSSSQGGGGSGSVGVAASVAVNVVTANSTAAVTHGATVSALNAVTIQSQAEIDATAQAVGTAIDMDSSGTRVGVGVALNVVTTSNRAYVDTNSAITGNGITIAAVTPTGKTDDFIAIGAAAAGGKGDASVAGSVAINVISGFVTEASARTGTVLHSGGALTVQAVASVNPQTVAAGAAVSQGTSVGVAVAVSVLNVSAQAFIAGNADAGGALLVDAEIHMAPQKLALPAVPDALKPSATSIAVAGAAGTGSFAGAGSFIVDVSTLHADAAIANGGKINKAGLYAPTAGQTVAVTAVNDTTITSIAGALGVTSGSAGVGASLDLEILNKETRATIGTAAQVSAGGAVTLSAKSLETMISVTATVGGGSSAGIAATADIAVIGSDTEATVGNTASVLASGAVTVAASGAFKTTMIAGSIGAASTAGVGAANATLVHGATTLALIGVGDVITAGTAGGMSVLASESEDILSIVAGVAVGGTAGVAGSASVNVLTETTTASIAHGTQITVTTGGLTVSASDTTSVISVAGSLAAGGSAGIGVGVDVGTYSKHTNAFIDSGVTASVAGNIVVTAETSEDLISVAAGVAVGSVAVGVNAGVHVFTLQTRAFIGDDPNNPSAAGAGNVHAGGSIVIAADDASNINEIVGVLAAGSVGVAAGAGVNVSTKETKAFIGAGAKVTADGNGTALTVNTGAINTGIDTTAPSFSPSSATFAASAVNTVNNTITLGASAGLNTGDRVVYAAGNGGTAIGGLTDHASYYVRNLGSGRYKLYNSAADANADTNAIDLTTSGAGANQTVHSAEGIETSDSGTLSAAASGDRSAFQAQGQVGTPQLAGMDLNGDGNSQQVSDDSLTGARTTALGSQGGFRGVAVTATNRDEIRTFTVTFGAGSVGVAVSAGVDVVTADTEAYIAANAQVNASLAGANAAQSVLVGAGDDFYHLSVAIGVGVGAVGVAPAVGVNVITNTTAAAIGNTAVVRAANDVTVAASGRENVVMVGLGVAAGSVGVGAVVDVLSISNTVSASIGSGATVHAEGDVAVLATDDTHVLELSGALAGGFVGVGGAVGVMEISKATTATIGSGAHVDAHGFGGGIGGVLDGGNGLHTLTADGVIVQAQSSEDILHIVAAGAVGFVGVSGAVALTLIQSNTASVISSTAVVNRTDQASAGGNQSVYVNASNDVSVQTFVIGVAGGFVGVTGAVDVGTLTNDVKAEIQAGAAVTARNDVRVNADGRKTLTGTVISGAGGFVGAGASVSVWSIGTQLQKQYSDDSGHSANSVHNGAGDPDSNAAQQSQTGSQFVAGNQGLGSLTGNGSNANTSANRVHSGAQLASTGITSHAPTSASISALEAANPVPPGTAAVIRAGADIVAGDSIGVTANEVATAKEVLGQVAAGVVGVGAAVAVFSIADNVTAADDGTNASGGALSVQAILNSTVNIIALDLAAGFVGVGAGVVVINDTSVTQATLGSVSRAGAVSVGAYSNRTVNELSGQASIGAVGLGATFTRLNIHGDTTATVDPSAAIGNVSPVGSLSVTANATVTADLETDAVAAGIGAFSVNFAEIDADPTIAATIGDHAHVTASGLVTVNATAVFDTQANTFGVSAGGLAVGVSLTQVTLTPTVTASVNTQARIAAGGLTIAAITQLPASGYSAAVRATGSAGALVGITSTNSKVTTNSKVKGFIASGVTVVSGGTVTVVALDNARQRAVADSNAFGLIAAGIATSSATSTTDTEAYIDTGVTILAGNLIIGATGVDDNFAGTNAGSGGLVAGAASVAHTTTDSTTLASVGASSHVTLGGVFSVVADHTAAFNSQITTFAGGLLAGAGADMNNEATSAVTAQLGASAIVDAYGVTMGAYNRASKPWLTGGTTENIKGTTGGLISGAGAGDTTTMNFTTLVTVGNNAFLKAEGVASNNSIFNLNADNDFSVHDKVSFETGGVLSGAGAYATINVATDIAHVTIGTNATLWSQGALGMTARGQGELVEDVAADTFGLGTVSVGSGTAELAPDNQVVIGTGSVVTAYGDLNLGAGEGSSVDFDKYTVEGRFDGFAGSLIPISDLGANAFLTRHNTITIDAGAHLMTARQANLDAEYDPIASMTAFAKAVSWASDVADAILRLTGGGGVEVHAGEALAESYGSVINNGIVETGINRHQSLVLNSGTQANPIVGIATQGVTFHTGLESVSSSLVVELQYDQTQLQTYGGANPTLKAFYTSEINRITNLLLSEGLAVLQPDGHGGTVLVPVSQPVLTVTVDPIWADAGLIDVRGNQFSGTGQFIAPSDASVSILNHSPAFLNLLGINIPDDNGGLYYDGARVTTDAAINAINASNAARDNTIYHYSPAEAVSVAAFNLAQVAGGPSAIDPSITVINDFDANQYNLAHPGTTPLLWPDITILAPSSGGTGVFNLGGSVLLQEKPASSQGNIYVYGPLQAKSIQIITNGSTIIQGLSTYANYVPWTQWNAVTTGVYDTNNDTAAGVQAATPAGVAQVLGTVPTVVNMFASRIIINADFIDIDGIIQSGQEVYTLTLGAQANADIGQLIAQGATGLVRLVNESTQNFDVFFNMDTRRIEVADLAISGGYVNLTGHIMETGNGRIKVLGGYGTINIVNNTNYDIGVHRLDASVPGQGTLLINDLAKNGSSASTATIYQDTGTGIKVTTDPGTGPVVSTVNSLSTIYNPASGWRYGWNVGLRETEHKTVTLTSSDWLGLIDLSNSIDHWDTIENTGVPKVLDSAGYFYYDPVNPASPNYNYGFSSTTHVLNDTGPQEIYHHEESTWYGEHSYTATFVEDVGQEVIYNHNINAARGIGIDFTGGVGGTITVNSSGFGNVYLEDAVLNPSGTTTIISGGAILVGSANELVSGKRVVLQAQDGVGTELAPIQVNVSSVAGASFVATTTFGDIDVNQVAGNLAVDLVKSVTQGTINLRSLGGITAAVGGQDLVSGGVINLTAVAGGIGNSAAAPLIVDTPNPRPGLVDRLTVTARTDVFLQEKTGDLRLNSVTTGGNVWISVPNGNLLNANQNVTLDERTYTELLNGVWSDLQLTDSTGYQQKVADTLDSFVGANNAEYETYWQFRHRQADGGAVYDPNFKVTLSAAENSYYVKVLGYNAAAIQTLVNSRTAEYHVLNAIYGMGGSYAAQDATFKPNVYQTTGGQISASAYFTAGAGGTPGTITRTDGGSWITDGFAVGQRIVVGGSAADGTAGGLAFTITGITGAVLKLSAGDVIAAEASAALPEKITVQHKFSYRMTQAQRDSLVGGIKEWTENQLLSLFGAGLLKDVTDTVPEVGDPNIIGQNVTLITGKAVGQTGGSVLIDVSKPPVVFTPDQRAALAAAERTDVQYLAAPPIIATVNFTPNTITRIDGGNWNGFSVGGYVTINGANGQITQNATLTTVFYKIVAINGTVLTIDAGTPMLAESGKSISIAPIVLDPSFKTVGAGVSTPVYFAANTGSSPGTITRTTGSWIADGFVVGQLITLQGSARNATQSDVPYTITGVTATTLTLSSHDLIRKEASAGTPETVTITRGIAPAITSIQILKVTPINLTATGLIDITAGSSVYIDSTINIRLDQVAAGDTLVGADIRIKGKMSILDGGPSSAVNVRGASIILEAATGSIGSRVGNVSTPLVIATVGAGTLTARAQGIVDIYDVATGVGNLRGDMNIESVYSATNVALLSADGSILDALNNDFTKIKATQITLFARNGSIGGLVGSQINYLDIDSATTITADAGGSIWLSENTLSMNVNHIQSNRGDVTLRAAFSILDAASTAYDTSGDPSLPATDVTGRSITLIALTGGIGAANNALDINSQYSGTGTLTVSSPLLNIYLVETRGDVMLNTVSTGATNSAFITAPTGSILNGAAAGVFNVLSGNTLLFANHDIGADALHITTQVGTIEAQSTTGSTWIDNAGVLSVGGSFTSNADGIIAGGSVTITASSPVTLRKSILSGGSVIVIAHDDALDGNNPAKDDVPDNLTVNAKDLQGHALFVKAVTSIRLLAGDNLTVQAGSLLEAGVLVYLQGDYQGGLSGNPPRDKVNADPLIGSIITVAGTVIAPTIAILGENDPDTITVTNTATLLATFPWNPNTWNSDFGALRIEYSRPDSGASSIIINGQGGDDKIVLWGKIATAQTDIYGGAGNDSISLNPANTSGYTLSMTGQVNVWGGDGTDTITVNKFNTLDLAHKFITYGSGPPQIVTGLENPALRDTVYLDGQGNADQYTISLSSQNDVIFTVHDSGDPGDGSDVLTINGTAKDDTFLMRADFVALLQAASTGYGPNYERVNYDDTVNVLQVNALDGNDHFYVDDNSAITTLDGGRGNDTFQFGQFFGLPRASPYYVQTHDEITTYFPTTFGGYLSHGISFATVAYGGDGQDSFTVYSNQAPLTLRGEGGDDSFTVAATPSRYSLWTQDPVALDGGDGVNSTVVLGSDQNDSLVVTATGVAGAGLSVTVANVRKLEVDAGEGDDHFYVLGTPVGAVTTLIGGLGNDQMDVGGDVTTYVQALDIEGEGGAINHVVSSNDPAFNGIYAPGVAVAVASQYDGTVMVNERGGNTVAVENGAGTLNTDSYTLQMAGYPPDGATLAYITVSAALSSFDDASAGGQSVLVSTDNVNFHQSLVLTYDSTATTGATAWGRVQTIYVRAVKDGLSEGERHIVISHSIQSSNPVYDRVPIADVVVDVIDASVPGVLVTQSTTSTELVKGGPTGTYTVALTRAPAAGETVSVKLISPSGRLVLTAANASQAAQFNAATSTITFTAANWSVPFVVKVAAIDGALSNPTVVSITETVTSSLASGIYSGGVTTQASAQFTVGDSRLADVIVTETNGSTLVAQGVSDYYTLQLSRKPTADVTVRILTDGQTLISAGNASDPRFSNFNGPQVTFTAANWNVPFLVRVDINPNSDSGTITLYPAQPHIVSTVQGALVLEGDAIAGRVHTLPRAVILPTEADAVFTPDVATGDVTTQTDTVNIFNDGSRANDSGRISAPVNLSGLAGVYATPAASLTAGSFATLTGLGTGPGITVNYGTTAAPDNRVFDGGITVHGVEVEDVMLGSGNDSFTVNTTLGGSITVVQGGGGSDTLRAKGHAAGSALILFGDSSQDGSFYNSTTANPTGNAREFRNPGNDILDASLDAAAVVLYGGAGKDTIRGSKSGSWIAGGGGSDTITTLGKGNIVLGDDGFNLDLSTRLSLSTQVLLIANDGAETDDPYSSDPLTAGGDTITGGKGGDVLIGDHGAIDQISGTNRILDTGDLVTAQTTRPEDGAADAITVAGANNLIIGGSGGDKITAGEGDQIIVADNGGAGYSTPGVLYAVVAYDVKNFGNDTVTAGGGNDVILGGVADDRITVGKGNDIVIGDNGALVYSGGALEYAETLDPSNGGNDAISAGFGHNVIFGGAGDDRITAGNGGNIILGGNGNVTYNAIGAVTGVQSTNSADAGLDTINPGAGQNIVLQGPVDVTVPSNQIPVWQMAAKAAPANAAAGADLTAVALRPIITAAERIWEAALGPHDSRLAALGHVTIAIGDLPDDMLGETIGDRIVIDRNAAGWGWFIDQTPADPSEFMVRSAPDVFVAAAGSPAAGHMDLLSTVLHEMGNAMGLPEDIGQDVTSMLLPEGERLLPTAAPVIDWGRGHGHEHVGHGEAAAPRWVGAFVNQAGRDDMASGPNAGFRIRLPVAV